jgi:16S rRNA (uracil1498-N3)-methyltransferase
VAHIPRLFLAESLAPGPVLLRGDAAKRLASVMRLSEGASVLLFSGDGKEWHASAGASTRDSIQLRVTELARQEPPPAVVLETWVGVIRASRFDDAVEKLVEAGADIIRPVVCEFSQRSEAASPARMERWRRIAVEASEQCGRLFVPEVLAPVAFSAALDRHRAALVVATDEGKPAAQLGPLLPRSGHLAVVVGPEGGLSPAEAQALSRRGALPLCLGPYILRTETAAVVATAVLRALTTPR